MKNLRHSIESIEYDVYYQLHADQNYTLICKRTDAEKDRNCYLINNINRIITEKRTK